MWLLVAAEEEAEDPPEMLLKPQCAWNAMQLHLLDVKG